MTPPSLPTLPPLPPLPPPRRDLPFLSGKYTVTPSLSKLAPERAFELDTDYPHYLAEKRRLLSTHPHRHFQTSDFPPSLQHAVCSLIASRLHQEWPTFFSLSHNTLTHLPFNHPIDLTSPTAFDTLARHLQEDLVVIRSEPLPSSPTAAPSSPPLSPAPASPPSPPSSPPLSSAPTSPTSPPAFPPHSPTPSSAPAPPPARDWNAAIHLCFPNGWSAEEKIGQSFFHTHTPVAGIDPINNRAAEFVRLMIQAESGLQRYVWGLRTDPHLNHHPHFPSPPPLPWNPTSPQLFARIERQIILGLPSHQAALFLIRTYLLNTNTLTQKERLPLATALDTMTEQSATYKGLAKHRAEMSAYLRTP